MSALRERAERVLAEDREFLRAARARRREDYARIRRARRILRETRQALREAGVLKD